MQKIALLIVALYLAAGCTHSVHLNHTGDILPFAEENDFKRINAESEQFTIMGMVGQTDYVQEAYNKLQEKCPDGTITGIQTRFSTSHGFYSWTNKIKMIAYCVL